MFFYISIGALAVLAVVAVVLFVRWVIDTRKAHVKQTQEEKAKYDAQQTREDTIKEWCRQIMSLDRPSDIIELGDGQITKAVSKWKWYLEGFPAYPEEIEGYREARKRLDEAKLIVAYGAADQTAQLDMLCGLLIGHKPFPSQLDIGYAKDDIPAMINEHVQIAREDVVVKGSSDAVERYNVLRHSRNWVQLKYYGVETPDCPESWNDLVARYYITPGIETFDGFAGSPVDGRVRLWASQALKTRSLTLGKVVLAYCGISKELYAGHKHKQVVWPYRDEIGDVLLAEVTKMVHALHVEQELFGKS